LTHVAKGLADILGTHTYPEFARGSLRNREVPGKRYDDRLFESGGGVDILVKQEGQFLHACGFCPVGLSAALGCSLPFLFRCLQKRVWGLAVSHPLSYGVGNTIY
jgi:hypothetical protein